VLIDGELWMKRLLVHALLAPGGTDKKSPTDIKCTILLVSMVAGQASITGEVCVPASLKEPAGQAVASLPAAPK
jgi:hypothetical protein